jgi:hypothetical protein
MSEKCDKCKHLNSAHKNKYFEVSKKLGKILSKVESRCTVELENEDNCDCYKEFYYYTASLIKENDE